jgi:hypothetical protein
MLEFIKDLRRKYLWRRYIKPCLRVSLLKQLPWDQLISLKECIFNDVFDFSFNLLEVNKEYVILVIYRHSDVNSLIDVSVVNLLRPKSKDEKEVQGRKMWGLSLPDRLYFESIRKNKIKKNKVKKENVIKQTKVSDSSKYLKEISETLKELEDINKNIESELKKNRNSIEGEYRIKYGKEDIPHVEE